MVPGREVAADPPEVAQHRAGRAEARPTTAETDVEASTQDHVRPPERRRSDRDHAEGRERCTTPLAPDDDVERLCCDDKHRVRMTRQRRKQYDRPEREPLAAAALQRAEERDE